jgi:hypothetical protein
MDRSIVTNVGIEDLKFALSEVAENLSAHVNASLSKAHGINIVNGYIDASGNDLTKFRDSLGNIMGDYFLQFTVDAVNYWAPAKATALAGQADSNGSVDTSTEEDFEAQGGSAWVTDYTSDQTTQAQSMNTDVLIPHTRQPHWNTHGGMTVATQNTFNSVGGTVGDKVIRIRFGDNVYSIPVSSRFGGPVQPPRVSGIPLTRDSYFSAGSPNNVDQDIALTFLGGTLPVAYHWQFFNGIAWVDITPAVQSSVSVPGWDSGFDYQWASTSIPTFHLGPEAHPGGGQTRSVQLRCRVTNPAVPDTGVDSGVITNVCIYTAQDDS